MSTQRRAWGRSINSCVAVGSVATQWTILSYSLPTQAPTLRALLIKVKQCDNHLFSVLHNSLQQIIKTEIKLRFISNKAAETAQQADLVTLLEVGVEVAV